MKKNFTNYVLLCFLLLSAKAALPQTFVKQVIVLNEGAFGTYVTVGSYDPVTRVYQNFDTLPARFATCVIIDNGFIYVAADTLLVKYNLDTKQRLNVQTVEGIRKLAVWNNQLLVTRAEINSLPSYFQVYDKYNLGFIYELTNLSDRSEGIKVLNDTAYVGINGFGVATIGRLAVIDLNNRTLTREIDLGPNGGNPENVEVERANGRIFTVNNMDWSNSSVTRYETTTGNVTTTLMNRSSGCSGSSYYLNNVYFQTSGESKLCFFSTSSLTVWDSLLIGKQLYGIGIDTINARIYIGITDYTTYGKTYVFDFYGMVKDSFDVNISPGNFAFDVRTVSGISETSGMKMLVRPNPVINNLLIAFPGNTSEQVTVSLSDETGREVLNKEVSSNSSTSLSLEGLSQGIYFIKAITTKGVAIERIVKQ